MTTYMEFTSLHFTGIGGSGMSALAQAVRAQGISVSGSDRSFDNNPADTQKTLTDILKQQGITIYPQDGSGVRQGLSALVVSTAIEETNPDVIRAKETGLKIITRAQLLSYIFNTKTGVAVGGTSGKSTVAAMIAFILHYHKLDPLYIGGGIIKNFGSDRQQLSNVLCGKSDVMCVETDESDGSIVLYRPKISVITNITRDHKEVPELLALFAQFICNTQEAVVVNNDCPLARTLDTAGKKRVTYGIDRDADFRAVLVSLRQDGARFSVGTTDFTLRLIGMHNVSNALAAIAVCTLLQIPLRQVSDALAHFHGIKRRLELIGTARGIPVYDDFSHNGAKIAAALTSLKAHAQRVIAVFQPHGYAPTRLMKDDFIEAFSSALSPGDLLFIPDIYDAGGTANRSISSRDLVEGIKARGIDASYVPARDEIKARIIKTARSGDAVVVMGARDATLSQFCEEILKALLQL